MREVTTEANLNEALTDAAMALLECKELFKTIFHADLNVDAGTIAQIGMRIADEASRAANEAQLRTHQDEQEVEV